MNEEKYNPEIHCCRYWYKDFCECVKDSMKIAKKKSRDRNVNGTLNFLKKNNIDFIEGKVPNVVIINPKPITHHYHLKKKTTSLNVGLMVVENGTHLVNKNLQISFLKINANAIVKWRFNAF